MDNFFTTAGNVGFVVAVIFALLAYHRWIYSHKLDEETTIIVNAWILKDVAVGIRIGWWMLALLFAPDACNVEGLPPLDHCPYAEWLFHHKSWMTWPTSIMYIIGQSVFISHIAGASRIKQYSLIGISVIIPLIVTYIGY